jgi:DNA-binding winged helix-turn-helix (wHTH) protein
MAALLPPEACVRFGEFELNPRAGELRRNGTTVNLGEQPLRVLTVLLERRGEAVTREELRDRLWPADTFVDFEHGLNAAVKRLRDALGDSADTPRFIETIPRRGYRFIASPPSPDTLGAADSPAPDRWSWHGPARRQAIFVVLGTLLLMLGGVSLLRMSRASEPAASSPPPLRASLDTPPGRLRTIVFSPDGRHLV